MLQWRTLFTWSCSWTNGIIVIMSCWQIRNWQCEALPPDARTVQTQLLVLIACNCRVAGPSVQVLCRSVNVVVVQFNSIDLSARIALAVRFNLVCSSHLWIQRLGWCSMAISKIQHSGAAGHRCHYSPELSGSHFKYSTTMADSPRFFVREPAHAGGKDSVWYRCHKMYKLKLVWESRTKMTMDWI